MLYGIDGEFTCRHAIDDILTQHQLRQIGFGHNHPLFTRQALLDTRIIKPGDFGIDAADRWT